MRNNLGLTTIGIVTAGGVTLTALLGQSQRPERSSRTSYEKAYEVLDNPTWYENDPFLVQEPVDGKLPSGPPKWAPAGVHGRELSCILGVLNEIARDPAVAGKIKNYTEHHNKVVALLSVAGLVRHGEWTREAAVEFAQQRNWTLSEIQGMLRMSRTPLEEAYDVLNDPRWHEDDTMISMNQPVDGQLQEEPRKWTATGIAQKERDSILMVLAEYTRNPAIAEKLQKYAEHPNHTVAVHAVGRLLRGGEWTKESALEFARQRRWAPGEIQEMLRLGKRADREAEKRTPSDDVNEPKRK